MTVHGYELKNGLARFFRWLDGFFAGLSGLILIAMMLTISYDVIARYAFGAPTKWSLEVNEYFLLAVVYLSGAWTLRVGGHVRVDILLQRLSDRTKTKLEVFDSILGALFSGILTLEGAKFVYDGILTGARSETYLEVLQWPIRLIMVVGSFLLFVEFVFRFIESIKSLKEQRFEG